VSTFRVKLYTSPEEDATELLDGTPPRWAEHVLKLRGDSSRRPATSAVIEVLSEAVHRRLVEVSLLARKAESRGWTVSITGNEVVISSGLSADVTRAALERDGVWHIVEYLAAQGKAEVFV
jgi:hypothetical protein